MKHRGKKAVRDIVQFVELRRFVDPRSGSWDKAMLARAVLAEVPRQLVDWMKSRGVKPLNWK